MSLEEQFEQLGIVVVEYALVPSDFAMMDSLFPTLGARAPGARADAFTSDARHWLAHHAGLTELASRLLKRASTLSRLQAFDKSPTANWFVPWHQDRAEDGQEREIADLERTVALRIHLDACDEDNGPLDVIPGTHQAGRLDTAAIAQLVERHSSRLCLASRGDIVALRPLLLHRSQRAKKPAARRVIHIEYRAMML